MPSIRLAAAALAACAALALVACGGDTEEKNDYVDAVNEVTSTLQTGLNEVSSQGTSTGAPADVSKLYEGFSQQVEAASTDLSEIQPPEDVTDQHDRLVSVLDELSAEAENAADEVAAGGAASMVGVATQFVGDATRLASEADEIISEINSKLQE